MHEIDMLMLVVLLHASICICSMADIRAKRNNIGHVVLITSPLFGHMIPLLDFAERLSEYHHVTYIVSASKLDALKQYKLLDENRSSTQPRLELVGLIDGNDDDYKVSSTILLSKNNFLIISVVKGNRSCRYFSLK